MSIELFPVKNLVLRMLLYQSSQVFALDGSGFCPQMPPHNRHVSTAEVEMSCVWLLDSLLSQATNYYIQRSPC